MASRAEFRTEDVAATPRGWRVRTRLQGQHRVRIAFPPGPRQRGAGKVVQILHPKAERSNPACAVSEKAKKNPLELVIFGNPILRKKSGGYDKAAQRVVDEAFGSGRIHLRPIKAQIREARKREQKAKAANPNRGVLDPLLESYHTWRRGGASKEEATQRTLQGAILTEKLRKAFLRAVEKRNPPARRRKRNQAEETGRAVRLFQTFHGKDPKEILEKQRSAAMRSDYTALGDLEYIVVKAPDGKTEKIDFEGDGVKLASAANGAQLYLIGGNQNLNGCLAKFTADTTKDVYDLGEALEVQYLARKAVGNFEPVSWFHKFGEESGARPRLGYDRLRKEVFFAGGEYRIEAPGIIN